MRFYDFDSQLSTFNSQLLQPDEHSQTGILTSASNRLPAFPMLIGGILGICSRYSGATVPDFHRVPRHLTAITDEQRSSFSKNSPFLRRINFLPRKILRRLFPCSSRGDKA
jgi:hypothetical protein